MTENKKGQINSVLHWIELNKEKKEKVKNFLRTLKDRDLLSQIKEEDEQLGFTSLSEEEMVINILNDEELDIEYCMRIIESHKDDLPELYQEIERINSEIAEIGKNFEFVHTGEDESGESQKSKNKNSKEDDKENQSEKMWNVLLENGSFFCDESDTPYYFIDGIAIPIDSKDFMDYLVGHYYEVFNKIPNKESMSLVVSMSRYRASKNTKKVGVRVSKYKDSIIYDPCDEAGNLISITENGLKIIKPENPITIRFKGMQKAVINKGTIDELNSFLSIWNMDRNNKILLSGFLGCSFIPDIPHAILGMIGWQGSGKTSVTEGLRTIVDPNFVVSEQLRYKEGDLNISASHQWVLAYDNVNGIIPHEISNVLCRTATGQGRRTRKLYTDTDEILIRIRRIIIINGINEPDQNPDFNERTIYMELKPIHEENRLTDREVEENKVKLIPRIRGYILSLIPEAMKMYPIVRKELERKLPRMADFVIWGECFSRLMGYEKLDFLNAFNEAQKTEMESNAENDPVFIGIRNILTNEKVIFDKGVYKRTTTDVLDDLRDYEKSKLMPDQVKQLPKDARRLGRRLKALAPDFYKMGISVVADHGVQHIKFLHSNASY